MPEQPVEQCAIESDVVPHLFGLYPLVPENLLLLSLGFSVQQRLS
jgi:hypothetical protein